MATNAESLAKEKAPPAKKRAGRSPGFPFIPVGKALERAESLRIAEGGRPKHFSPWGAIAKAWAFGEKTGPMKQTMAALGYYGLFEFEGSGDHRSARLTDTAFKILLDKQPVSPERDKLIQQVALTPAAHKDLWNKWPGGLPSDATVETYLARDRGFSEEGAKDLITEFKNTLAFAKLTEPGTIPDTKNGQNEHPVPAQVGDFIQVEINGALQFDKPKRVRAVQAHEGKDWVFVEGSETGVPMEQAQVTKEGGADGKSAATPPRLALERADDDGPAQPGTRKSRFALKEGDVIVTFPDTLSADSVEDLDAFWQVFIKKARREASSN